MLGITQGCPIVGMEGFGAGEAISKEIFAIRTTADN